MTTSNDEIHSAILALKSRVEVIEGRVSVIARADRDKLIAVLEDAVTKNPVIGRIYLALDGRKTQDEIATELGISKATASKWLTEMNREYGMAVASRGSGRGGSNVYRHDREMESILRLSSKVEKWLAEEKPKLAKKAG
jgi:DNA-directed RNA polymerase specialized sigma subunit